MDAADRAAAWQRVRDARGRYLPVSRPSSRPSSVGARPGRASTPRAAPGLPVAAGAAAGSPPDHVGPARDRTPGHGGLAPDSDRSFGTPELQATRSRSPRDGAREAVELRAQLHTATLEHTQVAQALARAVDAQEHAQERAERLM